MYLDELPWFQWTLPFHLPSYTIYHQYWKEGIPDGTKALKMAEKDGIWISVPGRTIQAWRRNVVIVV